MHVSEALTDVATRLAALEDREAIRDLVARYGTLADAGDAWGAAALWAEDGVYDVGGFGKHHGRAAIAALLESDAHTELMTAGCAHVLSAPVIELAGDSATVRTYSLVLRRDGDRWEAHRVAANRWRLVRTDASWRVVERVNRLLDGDAGARMLIGG
jgi:uncharacterized protein (TIGR02246 family)